MKKYSIFINYPTFINLKILILYLKNLKKNINNEIIRIIQNNMKD